MVGLLTRLRITVWRNALRTSTQRLVGTVIGGLVALAGGLGLGIWLVWAGSQPLRLASASVVVMTVLTGAWWIFSIIASGVDASLEPRRFAVLPVAGRNLAPGLFVAALIGVPAAFLLVLSFAQVLGWAWRGWAGVAAVVGAGLGVATAVLGSRVVTTLLARTMGSRRGRDFAALVVSLLTAVPLLFNLFVLNLTSRSRGLFTDATAAAGIAGWTPAGWAWALPMDVATGSWLAALTHLALALALVVGLWWAWIALLDRELTSPLDASSVERVGKGRLLPTLLGTGVVGSIASRRVRAWRRDSRMVSVGLRMVIFPVFILGQALILPAGRDLAGMALVMTSIMAGLTLVNDLAFDGPAWWMHVATGVSDARDRWGRVVASTVVFVPIVALVSVAVIGLGLVTHPVTWIGASVVLFFASLGIGSIVGAWFPGVAPRPGGSPFAAASGSATTGCLTSIITMVGPPVLCLPVIVGAYLARDSTLWSWASLGFATLWGGVVLVVSVTIAGRRLAAHGPELLEDLRVAARG